PPVDEREPKVEQIAEMLHEAKMASRTGLYRSALTVAWAALEAVLRRLALRAGRHGRIGVQPSALLRELYSAHIITPEQFRLLEETRQLRTEVVHGLAPTRADLVIAEGLIEITHQLLLESQAKTADAS